MRDLVIVVPETLGYQANQMALLFGESPADVRTFIDFGWHDEQGNAFAVSATRVTDEWIESTETPAPKDGVDMEAAMEAYNLIQWDSETLSADHITVILDGGVATEVVAALGLTYGLDREEYEYE